MYDHVRAFAPEPGGAGIHGCDPRLGKEHATWLARLR